MAERRMFSKIIIDSDAFLEMPLSTQALYFHLAMRADDDGFISNPVRIRNMIKASEDDLRLLVSKRYVVVFDSGVIVIRHWRVHNYIQRDRYKPTIYREEKSQLILCENKVYTECIQDVSKMDTQVSIGEDRLELDKDRLELGKDSIDYIPEDPAEKEEILKKLVNFYEQNIAPISSIVFEHIDGWLDDVDSDLIMFAIEEAAVRNKRSWKYIEAILKEKFAKGIKIGAEARREKEAYESEQGSGQDDTEGFGNIGTHI